MKTILLKGVKIVGIALGSVLLLLLLFPVIFPGTIEEQIKKWTNQSIEGQLNFSEVGLSFFRQFPSLTLTLYDFSLTGSAPFAADTLIAGKALSFGIDLSSVFGDTVRVSRFYLDDALINIQADEKGNANYNIYKGSESTSSDSSNTRLKIEGIFINNCRLVYNDRSIPMRIDAKGFRYEGRGNMDNSQFDLLSKLEAESFDFEFGGSTYLRRRNVKAELLTGINTTSLVFKFAKNNLLINKLPVDFSGDMTILKDGYDIDLKVVSGTTEFGNIFSALPPDYDDWLAGTRFSGTSQIRVEMKGGYRAATGQAPDLSVSLWVHDGLIHSRQAPAPFQHFRINTTVMLPGLNPDSLVFRLDTLGFDLNGATTHAEMYVKGIQEPYIRANLNSNLDLAMLDQALGLSIAELRGQLKLKGEVDGFYRTGQNPERFRPDTIITAIPKFNLDAGIENGYLKYSDLPLALENIGLKLLSSSKTGKPDDISVALQHLQASVGEGNLSGDLEVSGLNNKLVKAGLKADLQLEDLSKAVPMSGFVLGGKLTADVRTEGLLDAGKNRFPATRGNIVLQNGRIQTPYYPHPIEQLEIKTDVQCRSGRLEDLNIRISPFSFVFEQQPFVVEAVVKDLVDIQYNIAAKGTLDLGKIYQVFAVKGYGIAGLLETNLNLRGTQADALAGRYERLNNSGVLKLRNFEMRSDDYPLPFFIPAATLRFEQEKAWLQDALLRYGRNDLTFNGYAQNFIGYILQGSLLQGKLSVASPRLMVDDFTALSSPPVASTAPTTASGIVLLPANMDLALEAQVKEIVYGQTKLQDFRGELALQNGQLRLKDTRFNIAGATVSTGGSYGPVNLRKANFDFTFKADSFDVKRAYNEVPLFREMATSAENAEGIVSVDYALQGRLNDKMEPVYPSIKGKGVVKMEQVKVNGLKLFGAVSKATGKDSIDNPGLKAVVMKSSIANNIITIERTKMKVMGFRMRIEGQTSMDGRLNLRFRLGLPPFGILGIPMTITGTSDNPIVNIRKGKEADELEEEPDEAEDQ